MWRKFVSEKRQWKWMKCCVGWIVKERWEREIMREMPVVFSDHHQKEYSLQLIDRTTNMCHVIINRSTYMRHVSIHHAAHMWYICISSKLSNYFLELVRESVWMKVRVRIEMVENVRRVKPSPFAWGLRLLSVATSQSARAAFQRWRANLRSVWRNREKKDLHCEQFELSQKILQKITTFCIWDWRRREVRTSERKPRVSSIRQ